MLDPALPRPARHSNKGDNMTTSTKPIWGIETPAAAEPAQPDEAKPVGTQAVKFVERPAWGSGTPVHSRRDQALSIRQRTALLAYNRPHATHTNNGDEARYPSKIGNFTKSLPHNHLGEVVPEAYASLLKALESKRPADFEAINLDRGRKLTSPQSGLAFDLEGPDGQSVTNPPPPTLDSAEVAAEMAELYEMALLRDLPFVNFENSADIARAAENMSRFSDFRGPKANRKVTPATLFRGFTPGDLFGPYMSQFMLLDIPYGSLRIEQLNETVPANQDYLTDYAAWLASQNGDEPRGPKPDAKNRRYLYNMRMLTHYVHVDALYEAYLNAALILWGLNANNALVDAGNPYKRSGTQIGFATFGGPHILSLVTEVATRALKAVWYQKWFVHRRLRPEAFGGLVHHRRQGSANYPIHSELLNSSVLDRVCARNNGSYLLPMAFKEGSPTHPAYGAGHATVAGACVTILKAWFDETFVMPDPVQANVDGTKLEAYTGADAARLTVGNELNKLAANVGVGRNMAGVHWRSDYVESMRLGEQVAIGVLEEQSLTYNEQSSFTFTTFDGKQVLIQDGRTIQIA